jgi:hypothetical protein
VESLLRARLRKSVGHHLNYKFRSELNRRSEPYGDNAETIRHPRDIA